ncbi:hydroxymethylbilane synthase [Actinotalea sp. K2]|uniref:hydroxymethylbilane synthase n=1 Tax=Actinotalea sp. K2 TaxID=2939438 RepID=UPI0020179647|nr:hydroxymethylbilane synthase [Actinotalea sp. K2]MCL3861638.1 hydroxymethylbilane synthase [Actinotalea sp. K2]
MTAVRIGTRGSTLALTQTGIVADQVRRLGGLAPEEVELVRIRTEGDLYTGSLAALGGAGVFVAALREAVLAGRCDLAVHSLKDLPVVPAHGLVIAAVPERVDPRDALCARDGLTLADLPHGARVGTGSPRRAAQLLAHRPDLEVVDIRGNVETRLGRVRGSTTGPGDLDAVVLAAAGLSRLGRTSAVTELLDTTVMSPAPGQGALAVECRSVLDGPTPRGVAPGPDLDDPSAPLARALTALDHLPSHVAVHAERALLATLEAGCAAPVGALGRLEHGTLRLDAVVSRGDGTEQVRSSAAVTLPAGRAEQLASADALGRQVALQLLDDGAARLAPLGPVALRSGDVGSSHLLGPGGTR